MRITVISVQVETVPTAKGSYQKAAVAYKDEKGKITGKNIVSFVYPEVWKLISIAQNGDVFDVVNEKIKDNWNWTSATRAVEGSTPAQQSSAPVAKEYKSTYETPEERAKKQVYIIRQSSLSSAIAYATGVKAVKTVDELIAVSYTHLTLPTNREV